LSAVEKRINFKFVVYITECGITDIFTIIAIKGFIRVIFIAKLLFSGFLFGIFLLPKYFRGQEAISSWPRSWPGIKISRLPSVMPISAMRNWIKVIMRYLKNKECMIYGV